MNKNNTIGIIYAGGTFGSYGKPLASLAPDIFLPILQNILEEKFANESLQILDNHIVKDSSQLTPSDFAEFYRLIINHIADSGLRQFVILTGTDTLSYLSAFLAESFAKTDICVVVTGAMQPLLDSEITDNFVVNPESDASQNLFGACQKAWQGEAGVQVFFSYQHWFAQTVQKIHSHDKLAFVGENFVKNSQCLSDFNPQLWLNHCIKNLDNLCTQLTNTQISTIYLTPMTAEQLAKNIENSLQNQLQAIVLMGFGSGNVPHSVTVEKALQQAKNNHCLVVITTQCPFGGVSATYQAGAWLANCDVLSAGQLTLPAVFARLLWLCANETDFTNRQTIWKNLLNEC